MYANGVGVKVNFDRALYHLNEAVRTDSIQPSLWLSQLWRREEEEACAASRALNNWLQVNNGLRTILSPEEVVRLEKQADQYQQALRKDKEQRKALLDKKRVRRSGTYERSCWRCSVWTHASLCCARRRRRSGAGRKLQTPLSGR